MVHPEKTETIINWATVFCPPETLIPAGVSEPLAEFFRKVPSLNQCTRRFFVVLFARLYIRNLCRIKRLDDGFNSPKRSIGRHLCRPERLKRKRKFRSPGKTSLDHYGHDKQEGKCEPNTNSRKAGAAVTYYGFVISRSWRFITLAAAKFYTNAGDYSQITLNWHLS